MGKAKAKKGTKLSPGRGRPKKDRREENLKRKDNYRSKYSQEDFQKAFRAVQEKRMSAREAEKHYNVPRNTLGDRVRGQRGPAVGRPTVLSAVEEEMIVERLLLMGNWGFPLSRNDLRYLIQSYLNSIGKTTRNVKIVPMA
jgi:helix-turn-helix, Psq domain